MAFNICNKNNRFNIGAGSVQKTLNLTKNTGSTWIYCNYPEYIPTDGLGDKNKGAHYLNQVIVGAGTHNIFYSHFNAMQIPADTASETVIQHKASGAKYYGIQIWNPYSTTATIQVKKRGHHNCVGDPNDASVLPFVAAAGVPVREYFNSTAENTISLAPNTGTWICDESIPEYTTESAWMSTAFSGMIEFSTSAPVKVIVYAYNTKYMIDGNATAYPPATSYPDYERLVELGATPNKMYSGYADYDGYETNGTIELTATEIMNGSVYFVTNHNQNASSTSNFKINGVNKKSDSIPITLFNEDTTVSDESNDNLGNWGTVYKIKLKLTNDTSTARTFYGYVRCDASGYDQFPAIKTSNGFEYAKINTNDANSWRWLEQSVPAYGSVEDTYYFVLGTNSTHRLKHIFSVKYWDADLSPEEV